MSRCRQTAVLSLESLKKILHLPDRVDVMAVRQGDFGQVEITYFDPEPGEQEMVLDLDTMEWKPSEPKGQTVFSSR